MLDETSDIIAKSQLSTVLCYIKEGVSFERFVVFTDVSLDRTMCGLFGHITDIVKEFKIGSKLVGQTYNGALVMSGHLKGLESKVLEKYPIALFTHRMPTC